MKTEYRVSPLTILLHVLFFGMVIIYCAGTRDLISPDERKVIEDYSFRLESGEAIKLSDYRGSILVLETGGCSG